ncbi:MAG TPA: uracil-DNA glycosylase [Candidatus Merdivicinus excrementipullorum]|uniref:Uracil-DNA glycosylase n=1 Tax=Candidatus Merdivicinus excrementipullorum TaxID=2840867 RepID=A0A9D1FL74_9FIRM|nr:uracil-DNA glycosylase [Candidatus Merdivicinus excrementipullorum]
MILLGNDWQDELDKFLSVSTMGRIMARANAAYQNGGVYPPRPLLFRALELTPFSKVRAVILGQDPYHGPGQANGLAFSVPRGLRIPPSLRNIYKELEADCGISPPSHGDLTAWAENGVLLLNTVLTVRAGMANSHRKLGWETFTDAVIGALNSREEPVAFLLWGASAREKKALITNPAHLVLEAAHPSPLSAHQGFFGCRHFSKASEFCQKYGEPLCWKLPE